jgi:hypothetical protein
MPDAMHERTDELTNAETPTPHLERQEVLFRNARDVRRARSGLEGWEGFDWQKLPNGLTGPRRSCPHGWLYVIKSSFGVVKVGQSINPRARIQQHIKEVSRFDGWVECFWLSTPHEQWMSNESRLILWCAHNGRQTFGEYFADIEYEDAVAYAWSLVKGGAS